MLYKLYLWAYCSLQHSSFGSY